MALPRPRNYSRYVWARNRNSITILRWIGARASDIARVKRAQLEQGMKTGSFQILQPKTGKTRTVVLCDSALKDFQRIQKDIDLVFQQNFEKPLASNAKSNDVLHPTHWISNLNLFIKNAADQFQFKLSSHSFRIHYITHLLKTVPIQRVSKLVGHAEIQTTVRYDRFVIDPETIKKELNNL